MIEYIKKEYYTDVLVIGGGIAAVFAAIRALNNGAKVTLVDKGSIGRSGQTPFASAIAIFDEEKEDRESWHKIMAENAYSLNNPAYLDVLMDYSKEIYEELEEWGATGVGYSSIFRQKLIDKGVDIIERTMITTLLENSGKIAGAVGFKLDNEEAIVIKAKSVILCTGAGGFKPNGFQVRSLSFDGDTMAYRIGAKISGKEFVDTHGTLVQYPAYCWGQWEGMWNKGLPAIWDGPMDGGGQALDLHDAMDAHENGVSAIADSNDQGGPPSGDSEGGDSKGGPPSGDSEGGDSKGGPPSDDSTEGKKQGGGGGRRNMYGGASAGLGVHKAEGLFPTDNKCRTNIQGLLAAGDCLSSMLVGPQYNGVGGFSVSGSATQGALAGEVAAEYSNSNSQVTISDSYIESAITSMFEPLNNEKGYSPGWVEHLIQGTLIPYYVLYIKDEKRLKAALTNIEFFRDHLAVKLKATDLHDLRKAHEVKNMLLNAEMKLKASLFRTESRGNHYREDYPDSNDNEWLAWTVIQKDDKGEMQLEKFMIEDFKKLVI
jgi:succinate dehydrogenase/fumarate reductase flavoprotein subunit